MPKSTLFLSYDGLTDPLGQSQILPYLLGLSQSGYQINIISFEKEIAFQNQKSKTESLLSGTTINWFPLLYTKKPPVLSTIYDVYRLAQKAKKLANEKSISIVHCRSYITALVGVWLKQKLNIKLIFDMRGFWIEERIEGKIWNISNPIFNLVYKFFKKKEIKFINKADVVVSLTYAAEKIILQNPVFKPNKIKVIPCCSDTNLFDAKKISENTRQNLRAKLNINPEHKVVCYLGSLGTWYMQTEMLLFFKELHKSAPEFIFLIISNDISEALYQEIKKLEIPLSSMRFAKCNRIEVVEHLAITDLALFFVRPSFSKIASSPTKLAELLAMQIPVIANTKIGDMELYFEKFEIGYLIPDFTIPNYTEAIKQIPFLMNIDKNSLSNVAKENFDLQIGVSRYKEVYDSL